MGRRLALLIATYQYQDTGLRQLTTPAHDAEALAAVLQDPAIAGFEVTILINEPHHRVGHTIGDFYRDRRRDDLTLLYFTGHGLKDDDGRLYLAMTNTLRDNLLFTGLSAEQVDQAMEAAVSPTTTADSCRPPRRPSCRPATPSGLNHQQAPLSSRPIGSRRLWDVATGQITATLTEAYPVAFSPDSTTLATSAANNTLLWDVATGQTTATLTGHTDHINDVAFSPDGKTLATASSDKTVQLWRVAS